jgi:hypothetical protein
LGPNSDWYQLPLIVYAAQSPQRIRCGRYEEIMSL